MRHLVALSVAVVTPDAAAFARETIGIHAGWGVFRDASPRKCFAVARPINPSGEAAAALVSDPGRGIRSQLSIRLSRPHAPAAPVTLSVGERRFELLADGAAAWASDAAADRAIIGAMRGARSMSVETVDPAGRAFADTYALKGAATAIDAAAIACLG